MNNITKKINELKKKYSELSLKKEALLKLISETEIAELVYDSNAIENSTLSLDETNKILLNIELDRYISQRELFEAKNLATVISYIENNAKKKELNLDLILFLHKILLSNIQDDIAGRFRKEKEWVKVGNHIAIDPAHIVRKMEEMLIIYYGSSEDIVQKTSLLHLIFEHIHPFVDGNGRIGRVINNYLLIREGFVPINIKFTNRKLYYEAFIEFNNKGTSKIMDKIIGRSLINSYHKRITYLEGKEIISLNQYAKQNKLSHPNLINKAKRQTIPAFLEKNIWMIGAD